MDFLSQIYLASTIFSVGVVVLDLFGLLGQDGDDVEVSSSDFAITGNSGDLSIGEDDSVDSGLENAVEKNVVLTDNPDSALSISVLSLLTHLRNLVYFGLGFGPMGLFSWVTNNSGLKSLVWSIPTGICATILARLFFRFQQSETDSSLKPQEILFQQATVTIPISHSQMGKIRMQIGMNITERYAFAKLPKEAFSKDEVVWITEITDEYVFVERDLLTNLDMD